ncbi:Translation elongation factor, partial [Thalictrum thalictroides]
LQVPNESLSLLTRKGYKEQEAKRALRMNDHNVDHALKFLVKEKEKKGRKMIEDTRRREEFIEQQRYGMTPLKKAVELHGLKDLVSVGFEKVLAAEALRRNENDIEGAIKDLTNSETNRIIQLDIDSREKRKRSQVAHAALEEIVSMGLERSRVLEAVRASSNLDSLNLFDEEVPLINDNVDALDLEMETDIVSFLSEDALSDYDFDVTEEIEAIKEYLGLLAFKGK